MPTQLEVPQLMDMQRYPSVPTLTGTDPSKMIDTLFITFNPNIAGVPAPTSINLDNIVLTPKSSPTVPEPESFVLIGTGLIGLVRFRRFWSR